MKRVPLHCGMAIICLCLSLWHSHAYAYISVPFLHASSDGIDDTPLILDKIDSLDLSGDTLEFTGGVYDFSGAAPYSPAIPSSNL